MKILVSLFFFVALFINLNFFNIEPTSNQSVEKKSETIDFIYEPFKTLTNDLSEYNWPTDASYKITSSFAEFRPTHFHGGIDISTNLKEGFKVFASRAGYVAKIQILPNGYGKMIYLKHPDGYYTTYAHLKDFSDKIKNVLFNEQRKRQSYFVNIELDSNVIPIDKNEIIAYTGNTGAGPPHLHFEIRDENLNPVNPALFTNLRVVDSTPPLIKKFFIAPADNYSSVFEKYDYHIYEINSIKSKLSKPISVKGKIKFGIETKDFCDAYSTRTGVYIIELWLNDSLIYQHQYDRIPAEYAQEILLHYDLKLLSEKKGKFQKLYVEKGNNLPIYNRLPYGSGIIDCSKLNDGLHNFRIVVSDFFKNISEINGKLLIENTPTLNFIEISDSTIELKCDNANKISKITVGIKNFNKENFNELSFSKNEFRIEHSSITIPLKQNNYKFISISIYDNNQKKINSYSYKSRDIKSDDITLKYEIVNNQIKCLVKISENLIPDFKAVLVEGSRYRIINLQQIQEKNFIGYIEPDPGYEGFRQIKILKKNSEKILKETEQFLIYPIKANSAGTYSIDNGNIIISYDSNSVYDDFILTADMIVENGLKIYKFYPQDVLLKKGIEIKIRCNDKLSRIYFAKNGKWLIQNWEKGCDSNYLTARFKRTLTDVTVLQDTTPPWISNLNIKKTGKRIFISYRYKDDLSGMDYYNFKMYINNELVIPEIDDEKRIVRYTFDNTNSKKTKTLKLVISDKAGNYQEIYREIK